MGILEMEKSHDSFGARLQSLLNEKTMSQSDLARLVFNEVRTDKKGYEVVVGKDRISAYINDRQLPSPGKHKRICEALGVTPEELPLHSNGAKDKRQSPMSLQMVDGQPDMALIRIVQVVSMSDAIEIMRLVNEAVAKRKK